MLSTKHTSVEIIVFVEYLIRKNERILTVFDIVIILVIKIFWPVVHHVLHSEVLLFQ